jgi:hypothetical protein
MKGRDCDEDGNPLRGDRPESSQEPKIQKTQFKDRAVAVAAIDAAIKAWGSPDLGKGSPRECETMREALATLAGALEVLAVEIKAGRRDCVVLLMKVVDGEFPDQFAALQAIDERNDQVSTFFRQCLTLLNNVCRKSPEACLGGDPIVQSGLAAAMVGLAEIAKAEFGKRNFRFLGKPSDPRDFLEDASGAVRTIAGYWADFVFEAKRKIDPAARRLSPM